MPDEAIKAKNKASENLTYRALPIRRTNGGPSSLDVAARSVEVIVATENPVKVYDFERYEVINEVLLIAGAELPGTRQVPLLDSHRRGDSSSVIGSIRGLTPNGDMILGDAIFSEAAEALGPWMKVKEGHLTDFSAGYRVSDSLWIPAGETSKINGRAYEGPLKIAKKWQLKEVSVVPIGADEMATARAGQRADNNNNQNSDIQGGKIQMPEKAEIFSKEEIIKAERERNAEISAMCSRYGVPGDVLTQLIDRGETVADAKIVVSDMIMRRELAKPQPGYMPPGGPYNGGIEGAYIVADASDKRRDASVDGLCLRAGVQIEKPAPGADEYRGMTLADVAADCLQAENVNTRGMTKDKIVRNALQQRAHITGDFPSIMANVQNKVLRKSYDLSPVTWKAFCNQTIGKDFKEMSRVQLSEMSSSQILEIPEHGEYTYGKFSDSKEVFQIYKYGVLTAFTRESIINDDLGALTRALKSMGQACSRKVNNSVYAVLTANSAMGDGKALFHADHGNFVASGSGAAPSEATLGAAQLALRNAVGLDNEKLNVIPKFIVSPAALEVTVDKLLTSTSVDEADKSSGVANVWHKKLTAIIDPILDTDSATGWYVTGDPAQIDVIEVCFLGDSKPYTESRQGWTVDGQELKVRLEYGVKAIDWRSLYFNFGV